ncbi:hypothetical protein COX59_01645 [Candidatus Beckwithbacteria bacterium CG_4_10_14_0_2_um_filter_47_25]|uniref:Fibronectin type-III domain-containing protein n=1 Tax=Candidatus Beckwithbacteria bacterium CG_4_10_14_0_2_um_filter_47_25 TaxID=1974493 RepID=A0A2M7W7L2_9BACT|nr:MAG: hypothetical protein COX59_01645 [Candidatus Beckwithbacteria bacterium CG_4_10_14_0_2_um_filter_47_25]
MINLKLTKIHFPTALGLLILLVAIGIGLYWVKNKTAPDSASGQTLAPKQVRLTNVTDSSFSVSWTSDQPTNAKVKIGTDLNNLKDRFGDDRDQLSGETGSFEVHYLTAKNLTPNTKYYFKIESGGKSFDNQGKPFEITTGPTLGSPPGADPVYGTVLTAAKTPAEGVIVYVNLANAAPLSALVKSGGDWALSLSTARTSDLKSYLNYDAQATIVNLLIQGGRQGTAPAITTTANDNPVPDIILGQSHDFRRAPLAAAETPIASGSGNFSLEPLIAQNQPPATPSGEVTLENPGVDGEVINATQPAFIGSGPPGTVLAIEIHSDDTYTGTATIGKTGDWEFIPPQGLSSGEHSITIAYLDSGGVEQSLNRSFVIAAAGQTDVPAITATPSGEISTDSGRTSMPSTAGGVPHPGAGDISLLLLLTGAGLLIGGLQIKKVV